MPDWWIGRKHSEETRRKMSLARQGKNNSFFGRVHSEESKAKISSSRTGKCTGSDNINFEKPRTPEVRKAISKTRIKKGVAAGSNNPNWKGGTYKGRSCSTVRYKKWRKNVFTRDNYTCQMCNKRGGDLEADHIKPWAFFPTLRFRVSNGRTLCKKCHRTTFKDVCKIRDSHRIRRG